MPLNFDHLRPAKETRPTRAQERLYRQWRAYLKDSRLTVDEQHNRAAEYAGQNKKVPTEMEWPEIRR